MGGQTSATEMRLLRQPTVYGDSVVFSYGGDLWKTSLTGGIAERLTSFSGIESLPRFSPDGKWISFAGMYDGGMGIYAIPSEGGQPKRVTYSGEGEAPIAWTPDGKIMYRSARGSIGGHAARLWKVGIDGGFPVETPVAEFATGTSSPDGQSVAYNRNNSYTFNWRRYRGGTQGVVSIYNMAKNTYEELPHKRENSWHPMWVGDSIYFVSDETENTVNLYRYDLKSKSKKKLTNFNDFDIKNPSTDGKTIVFERNAILYAYDIASGKISPIQPRVVGDIIPERAAVRNVAGQIQGLDISPSGVRVAIEARGEVFTAPAKNGEIRNLTMSPASRERTPIWSPDGQTIAYMSDATGEYEIYTKSQKGGEATQLTTGGKYKYTNLLWSPDSKMIAFTTVDLKFGYLDVTTKKITEVLTSDYPITGFDWSPQSDWIVYSVLRANSNSGVSLYNVKTGKTTQVSSGSYDDLSPTFDLNGKYLYFVSRRSFNPAPGTFEYTFSFDRGQRVYALTLQKDTTNPFTMASDDEPEKKTDGKPGSAPSGEKKSELKIDLDGLESRAFALPWGDGDYGFAVGGNNGCYTFTGGTLKYFDFNSKQSMDIISGTGSMAFNASRNKIAYIGPGGIVGIIDAKPGNQIGTGRVNTSRLMATVDPKAEWKQIFWEAWRYERDRFYDKNFLGMDWNAIGKSYAAMLPYVAHRNDLNYVIGLMIGELGTSHSYNGGGDLGLPQGLVPVGKLGADFELVGGKVRIKRIYRDDSFDLGVQGPLTEPGMRVSEGNYLLAVDGNEVGPNHDPYEFLNGKVGMAVELLVNDKPSRDGAWTITVKPLPDETNLRYATWTEDMRNMVDRLSNGRLGYAHVPNTSEEGWIGLAKGFYRDSGKEGFIVDERYNGGGNIPDVMVFQLNRRIHSYFTQRNGAEYHFPVAAQDVPKVMLVNQYAGSGGDMFPWLFKKFGLGPLIGKRTWGGLVGINGGAPLVDGGYVTAPEFAIYDHEKGEWIAENEGISPDIDVDLRPDMLAQGRDLQIEKAVEVLLKEIQKPRVKKTPTVKKVK